jgi:hypothetical protein
MAGLVDKSAARESNNVPQGAALLPRVTCPHCWHRFAPQDSLWISQHPDLMNDDRLGADHQKRFLPTRFNPFGAAIDARGFPCNDLACPNCHLGVPRVLFQTDPFIISILGAPASGKSYLLAAMIWTLRKVFPKYLGLAFGDADPRMNQQINEYEELQFLNPNQDKIVSIRKTEEQGDLCDLVNMGGQAIRYPRPFVFHTRPLDRHPSFATPAKATRAICLYDNAGESFLPGADHGGNQVTRHLGMSRALFFLFDPTQDLRFRRACRGKTQDPQMVERTERSDREKPIRQDVILQEATERIRRQIGLPYGSKLDRTLIVIVTKYDCWSSLLGDMELPETWVPSKTAGFYGIDLSVVEEVSKKVRDVMWELTPEVVAAAESFAEEVVYIPLSAIGRSPEIDPESNKLGVKPRDIHPVWTEVPLLYSVACATSGLVAWKRSGKPGPNSPKPPATK